MRENDSRLPEQRSDGPGDGSSKKSEADRRDQLRQIEVSVIQYQVTLEKEGISDAAEIQRKCQAKRKQLTQVMLLCSYTARYTTCP